MIAKRRRAGRTASLRERVRDRSDVIFYKGSRITRVIEKNGKPLNRKQRRPMPTKMPQNKSKRSRKLAKQGKESPD